MSLFKAASGNVSSVSQKQRVPSTITLEERLQLERLISSTRPSATELDPGRDVVSGLSQTPKSLPAQYFYDDRGSQLFEQICELPEYYLTRTETQILQQCAEAIAQITGPCELVELGSGSSVKTRILLDAYAGLEYPLRYLPIDVSAGILESSARDLLANYPSLQVHGLIGTYELAMERLMPSRLQARMLCFLGSTLGNLSPQECEVFFSQITAALQPGEYFLLGVDLQKPKQVLEAAYNDRQGVTAAFNLNMLHHLNWRFEGNFDPTQFEHQAFYNDSQHQIEMHLRSLRSQTVQLRALNSTVNFAADETILSEISRKFHLTTLKQELQSQGLIPLQVWTDPNQWFGLLLCQAQSPQGK